MSQLGRDTSRVQATGQRREHLLPIAAPQRDCLTQHRVQLVTVGVFGKNLMNDVIEGNVAALAGDVYAGVVGNTDRRVFGAYRPAMKGRVYGL